MKRTMRGFLHLAERNKTNVVRLTHFFERPANTHVTGLSLAAIGRPFKGCDGGVIERLRVIALHSEDDRPARIPTTYLVFLAVGLLSLRQRQNDRYPPQLQAMIGR